ncbi:MAG TPA: hypothetical protein PKE06_23315 [Flavilitoribacter sp.]|nr:hypothetical protein [Flavilitoribacter sp.]HMQ90948.1 hypothetical protein [Flavilitoribacter sp.]
MRAIFSILFLFCILSTGAGQSASNTLTTHKWVLASDEMSGVGNHITLPENMRLEFSDSGAWSANPSLFGSMEGTWSMEKNGQVTMIFGPRKRATITEVTADRIKIRFRRPGAKRVLVWKAE